MENIRYKRHRPSAELAAYARLVAEDNSRQLQTLQGNVVRALREEVTPRQREILGLYYGKKLTMQEIADELGVDRSTISRTIRRGEDRLRRCLRYGAGALLDAGEDRPRHRQKRSIDKVRADVG